MAQRYDHYRSDVFYFAASAAAMALTTVRFSSASNIFTPCLMARTNIFMDFAPSKSFASRTAKRSSPNSEVARER